MEKETEFYKLLLSNNEKDIHDFIISNGKKKTICPISFSKELVDEAIKKYKINKLPT